MLTFFITYLLGLIENSDHKYFTINIYTYFILFQPHVIYTDFDVHDSFISQNHFKL